MTDLALLLGLVFPPPEKLLILVSPLALKLVLLPPPGKRRASQRPDSRRSPACLFKPVNPCLSLCGCCSAYHETNPTHTQYTKRLTGEIQSLFCNIHKIIIIFHYYISLSFIKFNTLLVLEKSSPVWLTSLGAGCTMLYAASSQASRHFSSVTLFFTLTLLYIKILLVHNWKLLLNVFGSSVQRGLKLLQQ